MNEDNLVNWVSQPDVCRCCLSASGTWDLTASYVTEVGVKEVFTEILQECYGIILSHLTEFSPSRRVCTTCVGHLRDAARFRKQVSEADRYFSEFLDKNDCMERVIKYELQSDYCADDFPEHMEEPKADNSPSNIHIKAISKQNKLTRKRRKHVPTKRKTRMAVSDCESDSPLTKLSKKDLNSDINNIDHDIMENMDGRVEETNNKLDISKADNKKMVIKAEPELEVSADDFSKQIAASTTDNSPSNIHIKAISKQNKLTRKRRKHVPTKRKTRMAVSDCESDSPLTKLSKKDLNSDINNIDHDIMENMDGRVEETNNKLDISKADAAKIKKKSPTMLTESQIENGNIRSNIVLVLRNSSILPFRAIRRYKYLCFYCDKTCLYFKDIKVHIEEKHHDVSEKEISRRVPSPKLLVKAEVSDIRCKLCDATCTNIDNLVEHLVNKHNKAFHNIPNFKPSHGILGFHQASEKFQCHICKREFRNFRLLSGHMNDHSANYVCQHCGKNFISDHKLTQHVNVHKENELKFKCKICDQHFFSYAARARHFNREHKKPVFKCPECNEAFSLERKLTEHLVEAHNLKKPEYKCEICDRQLSCMSSLRRHVRLTHLKETQYSCEICGMKFVDKTTHRNHSVVHSGVKDFACKFCKKRFARSKALRVHLRIHLNERPYSCTVCKAAFVQKVSLKNHLRVHHPDLDIKL